MSASTNRPVAWGILGAAKIATQKVIPGMQTSPDIRVAGIASRDIAKAREAASALGIPKAYGSYEEMLADPEIEVVYNPLPNHLHVPWTIKAMEAGKHVLCEKPIALTAEEAAALIEARARTGKLVAEAFMIRFHPQWRRAREIVRSGEIGELRSINVLFCYNNVDPTNIRNMADIGGGGLYDIGCYAVASSRFIFEAEPQRVVSLLDFDPVLKTDRVSAGLADFGAGRQLTFSVSTQTTPYQRVQILGSKGRVEIEVPFNPVPARSTRIMVDDGRDLFGGGIRGGGIPAMRPVRLAGRGILPGGARPGHVRLAHRGRHREHAGPGCPVPLGDFSSVGASLRGPEIRACRDWGWRDWDGKPCGCLFPGHAALSQSDRPEVNQAGARSRNFASSRSSAQPSPFRLSLSRRCCTRRRCPGDLRAAGCRRPGSPC